MRKLVRFLLGSVRIQVTGTFPERFLNLCGTEHLPFWDLERPDEGTLLMTIPFWAEKRSKVLAKKAFCTTERLHQAGLPFFLWNFRSRYALLVGMAFAFVGAAILSKFILVVDVTGNFSLPDSVILTELEKVGFHIGCYGPGVDVRRISNEMLLEVPRLSFCTINISGIRAQVVVREAEEVPEAEQRWKTADIVASTDGIVLDVDAIIGEVLAEEGKAVLKGETLISGVEPHHSGDGSGQVLSFTEVRAEGNVWAQTRRLLQAATPLTVTGKAEEQKPVSLWTLKILKKALKFGSDGSNSPAGCDKITIDYPLTLPGDLVLPFGVSKTTWIGHSLTTKEVDRASAEAFLQETLEQRLKKLMGKDGEILSRKTTFAEENGVLTARLEAACLEQIGVRQPHQPEESPSTEE